jgi:Phosphate transport (Pho88)
MMIILGMMQVSKKIPFDDPQVLMGVRALYIVSNLLILGIYLYIQQQINKKKGALAENTRRVRKPD